MQRSVYISKPCTLQLKFAKPINFIYVKNDKGQTVYARSFGKDVDECFINFRERGTYKFFCKSDFVSVEFELKPFKGFEMPMINFDLRKPVDIIYDPKKAGNSPACIQPGTGKIFTNDVFKTLPEFSKEVIIEHEKGHLLYKAEFYCDLYATNNILKRGGNLFPIIATFATVLKRNPLNTERIKSMVEKVQKEYINS